MEVGCHGAVRAYLGPYQLASPRGICRWDTEGYIFVAIHQQEDEKKGRQKPTL